MSDFQKKPQEVFCKKGVLKNFSNFTGKHLKVYNFIKKRLQHRCCRVKFMKFLRTPILKNIWERLLLDINPLQEIILHYIGSVPQNSKKHWHKDEHQRRAENRINTNGPFCKIKPLTIFAKTLHLRFLTGFGYISDMS